MFIASPGGLEDERKAFRDIINSHNDADALERGLIFSPIGWEDIPGGVGRPQHLINQDVERCDYFVLVLFDRWGSPPHAEGEGEFKSGSEEEFTVAMRCHQDGTMRNIVVLFKDVPNDRLKDPGKELEAVQAFRKQLESEKKLFFETFDEADAFEKRLRLHLMTWVRDHEEGKDPAAAPKRGSEPAMPATPARVPIETPSAEGQQPSSTVVEGADRLVKEGRFAEAEEALAQVIPQANLDSLSQYGSLLVEKGSLESAEKVFRQLHDIAKEQKKRDWLVSSINNLARIYMAQGKPDLAESCYREALEVREAALGPNHPEVGASLNNLAEVYRSLRRYDEAETLLRRALVIQGVHVDQ